MTGSLGHEPEVGTDRSHVNQIEALVVASLCFEALRIAGSSPHVRAEAQGFKESRTAWDATRLANALFFWEVGHPETSALVETIDREATQTAGFELPNKVRRTR